MITIAAAASAIAFMLNLKNGEDVLIIARIEGRVYRK
jgi:hypothetical protein